VKENSRNPIVLEIDYLNEISGKERETAVKMFKDKLDQVKERQYDSKLLKNEHISQSE